jgi:hypothetical protein
MMIPKITRPIYTFPLLTTFALLLGAFTPSGPAVILLEQARQLAQTRAPDFAASMELRVEVENLRVEPDPERQIPFVRFDLVTSFTNRSQSVLTFLLPRGAHFGASALGHLDVFLETTDGNPLRSMYLDPDYRFPFPRQDDFAVLQPGETYTRTDPLMISREKTGDALNDPVLPGRYILYAVYHNHAENGYCPTKTGNPPGTPAPGSYDLHNIVDLNAWVGTLRSPAVIIEIPE